MMDKIFGTDELQKRRMIRYLIIGGVVLVIIIIIIIIIAASSGGSSEEGGEEEVEQLGIVVNQVAHGQKMLVQATKLDNVIKI